MLHVPQIKKALGISGVSTWQSSWRSEDYGKGRGKGERADDVKGAQIDLLIERKDDVINICEMKWSDGQFAIDSQCASGLIDKREAFLRETGTKKAIHITMITVRGVKHNSYYNEIQSEVTADDLFEDAR